MLEAFARGEVRRRVRGAALVAGVAAILAIGGLAVHGTDIAVESLQIGLVEGSTQADRSALGLDQGLIGDTVRVSALVKNNGTAAVGEFEVDFFFTETISGEHGRLGTQVVSGLEPGEAKRPVITFDTTNYSPGSYAFSAEADPLDALGDAGRCDNAAPRGACAGTAEESASKYSLTLLREGRHISPLTVSGSYPVCRMGALQPSLTVTVHNVGTETLSGSDLSIYGYYRRSLNPPANEFLDLVKDASGNPVQLSKFMSPVEPGGEGAIFITLDYSAFLTLFAPGSKEREAGEVLGHANAVQIRITVQSSDGTGTAQDLFLPAQFELSQFYSTTDLWTFPERPTCCSGDCAAVTSVEVEPAVAGGLAFHVARQAGGDKLYVLKIRTGEEKGTWSAPAGKTLTSPVVVYDGTDKSYHVYIGASDGRIYALEGIDKEEGEFFADLWQTTATDIVNGDTYIALATGTGSSLVVGSGTGAFVLDATNGQVLRKVTTHAPVTASPVYATATGDLWIAADQAVYRIPATGSERTFDANERITTRLVQNETGTALFFGTETGFVYAIDPSTCEALDSDRPLRSVVGISVASNDDDAVVFLTSEIGQAARVEYHGQGFRDPQVSARGIELDLITGDPAILTNSAGDDADFVFVTGEVREGRTTRPILVAWDRDLQEYGTVTVWGTSASFVFKPEEGGVASTAALLRPIIDLQDKVLLIASSDGYLYAFDVIKIK